MLWCARQVVSMMEPLKQWDNAELTSDVMRVQEWQLVATATAMVFEVIVGGRTACNEFLSTTTCAGGPHIDLYYENDGSGRQLFSFIPASAIVLAPGRWMIPFSGRVLHQAQVPFCLAKQCQVLSCIMQRQRCALSLWTFMACTLASRYFIQSVGTAGENNPQCGTYMGYGACGGSTAIASLLNTNPSVITWDVELVSGSTYTLQAQTLETCSPASPTYLGAQICSAGSNQVALATAGNPLVNQVSSSDWLLHS